jgi:stage V sporulation protein R
MSEKPERLFEGADWDFRTLQRIHDACEAIARSELGLDVYPNQIEVITAEQMLDATRRHPTARASWASPMRS